MTKWDLFQEYMVDLMCEHLLIKLHIQLKGYFLTEIISMSVRKAPAKILLMIRKKNNSKFPVYQKSREQPYSERVTFVILDLMSSLKRKIPMLHLKLDQDKGDHQFSQSEALLRTFKQESKAKTTDNKGRSVMYNTHFTLYEENVKTPSKNKQNY